MFWSPVADTVAYDTLPEIDEMVFHFKFQLPKFIKALADEHIYATTISFYGHNFLYLLILKPHIHHILLILFHVGCHLKHQLLV